MSTRRAKQHESDVIVDSGHRKWLKTWNHKGFGSKWRMEASGRAPKFRTRAYNRAKELENEILNKKSPTVFEDGAAMVVTVRKSSV